jgi:uncharacterized protein (TIGR03086 family)
MDRALVGGVAVLERAVAYALGSLALVTPEALGRPTPCRYWDLQDLLEHLLDSMAALQEAIEVGRVDRQPVPVAADVIVVLRAQATRLLGSWANAEGSTTVCVEDTTVTAPLVAVAGAIEVTVHGWDVAQACGRNRPIPDDLADELLGLAVLFIRAPDRPGRFGAPIGVPLEAAASDRLLAFLGRRPG